MNIVADYLKLNRAKFSCVLARNLCGAVVFVIICDIGIAGKSYGQTLQFRHYSTDEGFTGSGFKTIVQDSLGFLWITCNSVVIKFDGYSFNPYRISLGQTSPGSSGNVPITFIDPKGDLWLASPNNVSVFDRRKEAFEYNHLPLDGSVPRTAWFDVTGTIWIGTVQKGLISFDPVTKKYVIFQNNVGKPSDVLAINTVHSIVKEDHYLLLGTDRGLWRFDRDNKVFIRPHCSPADSALLYSSSVKKIFPSDDGYWIWTDRSLAKLDSRLSVAQEMDLNLIHRKFDVEKKFETLAVRNIVNDATGIFWLATQGLGLVRYDPLSGDLLNYRHDPQVDQSLPSDVLNDVIIDRDQNIWITTLNKGIALMKRHPINFYNYLEGKSTTGMDFVSGSNSKFLVTGTNGYGLWITPIDPQNPYKLSFKKIDLGASIKGFESVVEVTMGRDRLWAGSLQSGVMGVKVDTQTGMIDVSSAQLLTHDINNSNTISENFITSLDEDEQGHLWVGTGANGLNSIDLSSEFGKPGSVTLYRFTSSDSSSLLDDHTGDLKIEKDHSIIAATNSGLFHIKPASGASGKREIVPLVKGTPLHRLYVASDGTIFMGTKTGLLEAVQSGRGYEVKRAPLPGEPFITSIQEDGLGRIWASSFQGLFFYDRRNQFVTHFGKEDGMPSSRTVNAAGSLQTPEGIMIFSNSEGITAFDPLSLRLSSVVSKPIFTQLKINNRTVSSADTNDENEFRLKENINTLTELTLDHTQIILTIEFTAMDFTAPEKNLYKYKLEEFDRDWVYTDWKNRTATYTNLSPGTYTFKVVAANSDGRWSDHEASVEIHVLPPPWKTWWAYSLYAIVFTSLLFLARRNIIQHERLVSKLKLEHLELEKAQEIDKVKTNFFANISHEFRTPLTLIQGPVQLLLDKFRKDGETESQLILIQQNAERLLRLVNQILELARLESGGLRIEASKSDVIDFLRKIVGSFSSLAIQKRISFVQQFPDHGLLASFDKDKLEKIATNLISNAIKFTPENGAVIVNTSVAIKSEGKATLTFRVTDTGKGIPEDKLNKIFERFYQVKEDGNVNVGSGIGLALCKELAEFLGGSLTLESKVGEGSRFALNIPLSDVEQTSVSDVVPPSKEEIAVEEIKVEVSSNGHSEKPLLLIVEDHSELRKFIIACLGSNYQFVEASNGREGLSFAIDQVPTLILSDVMMPEMDGMEMCRKIKSDQRTSHIPVILITARASDESKLTGLETGADDYIVKPFNKDELVLKIRNQVAARARMQERIRLEFLSQGSVVKAVSADEKFLEKLKKIVEERLSDEMLSVESLTEEIGMSRAQLYRKVTALTGISGNEFIRKLRLQKAAQLLQQQSGPVSQVAYEVGFSNLSYFSKCFKEEFGVLPSEYGSHAPARR